MSIYINEPLCDNCCDSPIYDKEYWDNLKDETNNTNCYSYAFNRMEYNQERKLQPGELSSGKFKEYTCSNLLSKIKDDHKEIYKTDNIDKIPCNYYKIALVIDNNGKHDDYHFYRKDNNGTWSHKQGTNKITNIDASGNKIFDPQYADRNYDKEDNDKYNYNKFCGYFAIPYKGMYNNYNIYSSEDKE
tara:strand:+ start:812 stop:1375 length:564 start_codon:yes stop_codon:yes gene_type:complete